MSGRKKSGASSRLRSQSPNKNDHPKSEQPPPSETPISPPPSSTAAAGAGDEEAPGGSQHQQQQQQQRDNDGRPSLHRRLKSSTDMPLTSTNATTSSSSSASASSPPSPSLSRLRSWQGQFEAPSPSPLSSSSTSASSPSPSDSRQRRVIIHGFARASPLDRESDQANFRGLFNLCMLLLFLTNFRLVFENLLMYGFLLSVPGQFVPVEDWILTLVSVLSLVVNFLAAYGIELLAARNQLREAITSTLHGANIFYGLLVGPYLAWNHVYSPFFAFTVTLGSLVAFLKLVSFAVVNRSLRSAHRRGRPELCFTLVAHPRSDVSPSRAPQSPSLRNPDGPWIGGIFGSSNRSRNRNRGDEGEIEKRAEAFGRHGADDDIPKDQHQDRYHAEGLRAAASDLADSAKIDSFSRSRGRNASSESTFSGSGGDSGSSSSVREAVYPNNLSLTNVFYFMWAPTMCYQPVYPRTNRIRIKYLLKRTVEGGTAFIFAYFIVLQYIYPAIVNSIQEFDQLSLSYKLERILRIAVPSILAWMLVFYAFFHCFLNVAAELLRFGDRHFYGPWWNSITLEEYWRSCNLPIYNWLLLHVYEPAQGYGLPEWASSLLFFVAAAVIHELLIAIPFKFFGMWIFVWFLLQIPLISITRRIAEWRQDSSMGNYLFWMLFWQPLLVIYYFRHWVAARDKWHLENSAYMGFEY